MENLAFLRAQIRVYHPEWTAAQVEMEAVKIASGASQEEEDEGCLYCGS